MSRIYLMSAFHIDGFKRIKLEKLAKQEPNCRVAVLSNRDRSWITFASGCGISKSEVGKDFTYIKDTGLGYAHVPYDRQQLTMVNVVDIKGGVITSVNDIGLSTAHSMKVYK